MTAADQDTSFIAEALPAFISEAQEQIASIEQLLLQLESAPADRDLLDALFRCAHTVKGSAGIFGLDAVVAFTHHVETLLDHLREGSIGLTPELSTLLLRCNDQIRRLIDQASGGLDDAEGAATRAALVAQLGAMVPSRAEPAATGPPPTGRSSRWHVSVTFGADTFRNGMDPLAILNYAAQQGSLTAIGCNVDAVPKLEALDPESCHLSFVFQLVTERGRQAIDDAFSFVAEDAQLHVIGPDATPEQLAGMVEDLPECPRLGEILMSIGAVTYEQLNRALSRQRQVIAAGETPRLGEILQAEAGVHPKIVEAALQKQQKARENSSAEGGRYIRVQADRLDAVINLLGELVIAGAGALLLARQTRQGALVEANEQIGQLIEEIRNGTLQLRMVPIGDTFSRFRRVVRDTAAELGKDVALEIVGGETELDKSMVERIADPLMHLVRNALDHGLETPQQRAASGKPAQGKLTLAARHESGSVVIRITDDGRGIQRERVLQRAWERGLVERGVTPPDEQILQLIFAAGFSTAEKVTNLSGRGVGMDVVRSNIEALRGSVTLDSVEGQGSTIEIRLPLTLAIIDGFLVGVGPSKFVFPLDAVVEVIENRPTATSLDTRGRSVIELRGRVLPVLSLRHLYALESPSPERSSVVVIQSGAQRFGVMVDTLLGQNQTVIKPLGRMFRSLRGMSGSTILGNGEVALIFDVASLSQLAAEPAARNLQPAAEREPS